MKRSQFFDLFWFLTVDFEFEQWISELCGTADACQFHITCCNRFQFNLFSTTSSIFVGINGVPFLRIIRYLQFVFLSTSCLPFQNNLFYLFFFTKINVYPLRITVCTFPTTSGPSVSNHWSTFRDTCWRRSYSLLSISQIERVKVQRKCFCNVAGCHIDLFCLSVCRHFFSIQVVNCSCSYCTFQILCCSIYYFYAIIGSIPLDM